MDRPPIPVGNTAAAPAAALEPEIAKAADSCRLLGILFVLLGGLPLLPRGFITFWGPLGMGGFPSTTLGRVLGIATTVVLVGPGVWYFVAGRLIRRGDARGARVSVIVMGAQAAVTVIGLVVVNLLGQAQLLSIPSLLGMYFVPALVVAAVQLVRARRVMEAAATTYAFDPLPPRPVLPLTEADTSATEPDPLRP